MLDDRSGLLVFRAEGKNALAVFVNETGGHRWQRIPPTEKRGRVQTSTITVAVLPVPSAIDVVIHPQDVEETTCRGSGAGGQHRNVTDSAVQLKHRPTGIIVRCETERSQHYNRSTAYELLRARLQTNAQTKAATDRSQKRRSQIGSGQRGDKIRTIRVRDGKVTDHRTDRRMAYKSYIRGDWQWE